MNRIIELTRVLSKVENLKVFDLCSEFERLSLDENHQTDNNNGESSSSTNIVKHPSYSSITPYLRSLRHTPWNHSITEQLKAPFIEYPRCYMDSFINSAHDLTMGMGFRFLPGQSEFLTRELKLPESFDRIYFISNTLGLSYSRIPPFSDFMLPYTSSGAGFHSIVSNSLNKLLVEVITYCDGSYGRFLVLVGLGIGCTVWYGFVPGIPNCAPDGGLFTPFDTYDPFLNAQYRAPGFRKINLLERNDISESVLNAIGNEQPFAEIMIPASGNVLKAVGLGVMVAIFLAVGIVPHATTV